MLKLRIGRLDAVYDLNAETMSFAAKQLNMTDQIKILALPEPAGGVNVVFSRASSKGTVLLNLYQQQVRESELVYHDFLRSYIE